MKEATYISIVEILREKKFPDQGKFLQDVNERYRYQGISNGTLLSIYSQEFQLACMETCQYLYLAVVIEVIIIRKIAKCGTRHMDDCTCLCVQLCYSELMGWKLRYMYKSNFMPYTASMMVRHIKRIFHRHHKPNAVQEYYQRFMSQLSTTENSGIIVTLAKEVEFPPVLITRIVLDEYLKREVFKERNVPRGYITQILKNPSSIGNDRLAKEIQLSVEADENCGPHVEAKKHQIGQHYEDILKNTLENIKIPFRDEHYLRLHGYDKTPDFKLEIPFAVDGNVVNWVESKASFGDEESHNAYLQDQYWGYCNRFGPGMVIYWFGFIEELDVHRSRGILLSDKFPDNIVTLESLL